MLAALGLPPLGAEACDQPPLKSQASQGRHSMDVDQDDAEAMDEEEGDSQEQEMADADSDRSEPDDDEEREMTIACGRKQGGCCARDASRTLAQRMASRGLPSLTPQATGSDLRPPARRMWRVCGPQAAGITVAHRTHG